MMVVGCAGFAVPATRYFKEYSFVEVQETHLAVPGSGTLRRWRREAPGDFSFALLGPREITQEGFRGGKVVETALEKLSEVATELAAKTAIFLAPPDFPHTRANRTALKDFLLQQGLSARKTAYYRLPGPAGHKSRYEDPAIERLAEIAKEGHAQAATYVFANVDMFADAKRFKRAAGM
jgi:uncharacterized protein YecE (DUF72 family)